jgi:hypothetical protein
MNMKSNDYGWLGWTVAAIISIFFVFFVSTSNNDTVSESYTDEPSKDSASVSMPTTNTAPVVEPIQEAATWQCVDATSYNQNAYDDNKCAKGDEIRYVSDSQAIELDPSYTPGKRGHYYYNSQ